MTHQLTGVLLGALMLGAPLLTAAAGGDANDRMHWSVPTRLASKDDDLPLSKDALFDIAPEQGKSGQAGKEDKDLVPVSKEGLFELDPAPAIPGTWDRQADQPLPNSKDALFGEDLAVPKPKETVVAQAGAPPLRGYFQTELARTYADPAHWSKALGRLELGTQGRLGQGVQWKLSGRVDYDAVYDLTDFYQHQVRDDQRAQFTLRENYIDFSTGDWDWRLGRQHIVWGEMVGLFFADVVSAKDLREFILPDFQVLRIPQWATRAEYFNDDFHAELIWIPFPSYDEIGKPTDFTHPGSGAEFYPYPPTFAPTIMGEVKPGTSFDHGNFGVRMTQLTHGWDMSGFYYTSMNNSATFYRTAVNTFTPRHDRIWQAGGTLAKDFSDFVLKAEAVYTNGRRFNLVANLVDPDGVVKQDTLDWAVGLDFNPGHDTRVNTQVFQSYIFDHDPDIVPDKAESGVSLLVSHGFPGNWRAEVLLVHSLNRSEWMFRPKVSWGFQPNWKLSFGLDVFGGPSDGLFGQYDDHDRAYAEVRYDF